MTKPNEFRLSVNIQIANSEWSSGGIQVREEVVIAPATFVQMADILEAFHVLCEKYRLRDSAT